MPIFEADYSQTIAAVLRRCSTAKS